MGTQRSKNSQDLLNDKDFSEKNEAAQDMNIVNHHAQNSPLQRDNEPMIGNARLAVPQPDQSAYEVSQRHLAAQAEKLSKSQQDAETNRAIMERQFFPEASQGDSILDLPEEVRKNIVDYETLELDEMIKRIVSCFNVAINVDKIIMLLYTRYKKQPRRLKVQERLKELTYQGTLEKIDGVRGMYKLNIGLITGKEIGL